MGKEKFYLILLIIIISIAHTSCKLNNQTEYSFYIAGHTYGKPFVDNEGFHPAFKEKFSYIKERGDVEFGFLLGDIVWIPSEKDWDIEDLGLPVYIACGNHEMKDSALFVERYDPNIDDWNILGDQLKFLETTISKKAKRLTIFLFLHIN